MTVPDDRATVAELLGRAPQGAFEVVVRHRDGTPLVIQNAPLLDDGTPMPTRFWLVGEPERTWVGRLESAGGVARAEAAVDAAALGAAHARYAAARDAVVPPDHDGPRPYGGVGGTRRGVKCLHAHYAWWLAGGDDPVGRWVAAQLAAAGLRADGDDPRSIGAATAASNEYVGSGPVAAIDCGTNSTRLLIAEEGTDGALVTRQRVMTITRLGQGVDATGQLAPEAIQRTLDVLTQYRTIMDAHAVRAIRATATSAARDASNRDDFFGPAATILGVDLELLSGEDEGRLSFAGATADLAGDRALDTDGEAARHLIVDIGGGSTEFAAGTIDAAGRAEVTGAESVNIGCVRITERFLATDPPSDAELAAASEYCRDIVAGVLDRISGAREASHLFGLAGTVSTLASVDLGLATYDRDRIHHHVMAAERIRELTTMLLSLPAEDRREVPGMESGRIEVIAGGLVVLDAVLEGTGADTVTVSEADILDGLAASLLK